jgi:hypothetical protein
MSKNKPSGLSARYEQLERKINGIDRKLNQIRRVLNNIESIVDAPATNLIGFRIEHTEEEGSDEY